MCVFEPVCRSWGGGGVALRVWGGGESVIVCEAVCLYICACVCTCVTYTAGARPEDAGGVSRETAIPV